MSGSDNSTVYFRMEFCRDPTSDKTLRFVSARLEMEFEHADPDFGDIRIRKITPYEQNVQTATVHHEEGVEKKMAVDVGQDPVHAQAEMRKINKEEYDRKSVQQALGFGTGTKTATWTFDEASGKAGCDGLGPHYILSVTLTDNATSGEIWIKYWCRAKLAINGRRCVLTMGGPGKQRYMRVLDLTGRLYRRVDEGRFDDQELSGSEVTAADLNYSVRFRGKGRKGKRSSENKGKDSEGGVSDMDEREDSDGDDNDEDTNNDDSTRMGTEVVVTTETVCADNDGSDGDSEDDDYCPDANSDR